MTSEQQLADARKELLTYEQDLQQSRQANQDIQRDLDKSRADLAEHQKVARGQQISVQNMFDLLRAPRYFEGVDLMQVARESQDPANFLQRLQTLPPHIRNELDLSRVIGVM